MSDILPMDAIELGAEADSCSMAVARAGELLVKAGITEARYISAMIDMVNKYGSYMVVAPGVAMPHSHSDKGVIRSGVSFLRLTKPVYFPGKEDQPIYLLIAVAARDNTAHLDLMGNVAAMISDDSSLAKVMSCSSVEEIYTMMNKAEDTDG